MLLSIDVGHKNLGVCCLVPGDDDTGALDSIHQWTLTSILSGPRAVVDTMRSIGVEALLPSIERIVVERQPGRNTSMVRLQHYLEMYFLMHDKQVDLQDGRVKLQFAFTTPFWGEGVFPETYHGRKKKAVEVVREWMRATNQPEDVVATFETSPKKDDLADCLLQVRPMVAVC